MDNYHTVYIYDWRKKREICSGRGQMGDPPQAGEREREGRLGGQPFSREQQGRDSWGRRRLLPGKEKGVTTINFCVFQVYGLEWNPYEITHQATPAFLQFGKKHIKVGRGRD